MTAGPRPAVRVTRGKPNPRHLGLGQRLAQVRAQQQLTLRALAERAGTSKDTPNAIETGRHAASLEIVERLATALGVSPAWLAFGLGPKEWPRRGELRRLREAAAQLVAGPDPAAHLVAEALQQVYGSNEPVAQEPEPDGDL